MLYVFENFELDTQLQELRIGSHVRKLQPQTFDILRYLVESQNRLVSRDELVSAVWNGRAVSESAIDVRVHAARKALGDDGRKQKFIKTVPRRGYRFLPTVTSSDANLTDFSDVAVHGDASRNVKSENPWLAVLPFRNISNDPEQEFFSDGITEDIINALSKFRFLRVISRGSSFTYKGRALDVCTIGRELSVRYVLEGSVRRAGDRVRISVELTDVTDGKQNWSERYERKVGDVFDLQDEITLSIVAAIEPELASAERQRAVVKRPEDLDAWALYHIGLDHMYRFDDEGLRQASERFSEAIECDPRFGCAYAALALVRTMHVFQGRVAADQVDQMIAEARALADQALTFDPKDSLAYIVRGRCEIPSGNRIKAMEEVETGITLNPNSAYGYQQRAMIKTFGPDPASALGDYELAERLSPYDPNLWVSLNHRTVSLLRLGRFEEAIRVAERCMGPSGDVIWPAVHQVVAHMALGNEPAAKDAMAEVLRRNPKCTLDTIATVTMSFVGDRDYNIWFLDCVRKAGIPE
jgi:adenylate cyclase